MFARASIAGMVGIIVMTMGASPAAGQGTPPADTAWRYRASADLQYLRACPAAELLLRTKKALVALDATTGAVRWELTDLPDLDAGFSTGDCESTTGLAYRQNRIVVFDLVSGRRLWDASALPSFQEIRGYVALRTEDLLLLFLRTPVSDRSLVALRLSTGERLWQRDDLFAQSPAFRGQKGVSDIAEYQVFIADSDTSLILYVTADGPMRLDRRSGATLWKGEALAGQPLPSVRDYAAMRVLDSVLVVPHDKGLVALDTRDGHVLWRAATLFPAHASRMFRVPSGLLVRAGRAHVMLLEPATGALRWRAPLTVQTDGAAYETVGDRYYVVTGDRLLATDLATGDTTSLVTLAFRDGEHASALFWVGDGLLVVSRQNLFRVDLPGTVRYHRFYRAPGASFFEVLGGAYPGVHLGSATLREQQAYFVTNEPDSTGRTGNSLVRVSLDDGTEAGRIWFHERAPNYLPDTARDQLLVFEDRRTLVALRFPAAPGAASRE